MSHELISDAIDAIGQPEFPKALAELCQHVSGHSSTFIAACFADHPPAALFDNLGPDDSTRTLRPYLEFAYMLDPFHVLFRSGLSDGVVRLSDCAPDDFRTSEYFQRFYAKTGLHDETALFVGFAEGAALILSLGTRESGTGLSSQRLAALQALFPVIKSLCHRHWPRLSPEQLAGQGRLGQQVEKLFDQFGSSQLSTREGEIMRLVLRGHSSKSMARVLGNSPETIRAHRKRIYAKLGVASQGELFSLFLDALTRTPPNAKADPLDYLAGSLRD